MHTTWCTVPHFNDFAAELPAFWCVPSMFCDQRMQLAAPLERVTMAS
jgi:hypothetical protein